MKLTPLRNCLEMAAKAAEGCNDPNVEVWLGDRCYKIESVGQFSVVPDVTITILPEDAEAPLPRDLPDGSLEHPGDCDCEQCDERQGLIDYDEDSA